MFDSGTIVVYKVQDGVPDKVRAIGRTSGTEDNIMHTILWKFHCGRFKHMKHTSNELSLATMSQRLEYVKRTSYG